jgi:tRNA (adenine57-N1/adenine58-N1)-methyltransferase
MIAKDTRRIPDTLKKLRRGPQIITLKDAAIISAFTGMSSGDLVVDAGSGSGFLAVYMGNLVRPRGRVVSYERRPEFAEIALENVKRAGLEKVVEIKVRDVFEGIDEKDVDVVTLDLPEPWNAVRHVEKALKEGGFVVSYVPTVEQSRHFFEECGKAGLEHDKTVECTVREMVMRERGTRPQIKGLMHTGYISFARKRKKA